MTCEEVLGMTEELQGWSFEPQGNDSRRGGGRPGAWEGLLSSRGLAWGQQPGREELQAVFIPRRV